MHGHTNIKISHEGCNEYCSLRCDAVCVQIKLPLHEDTQWSGYTYPGILGLGAPWQRPVSANVGLSVPSYHSDRRLDGPHSRYGRNINGWDFELLPQIEPRLVFRPALNLVTAPTKRPQKFTDVSTRSTSLNFCQTSRGHIPEDILNSHR